MIGLAQLAMRGAPYAAGLATALLLGSPLPLRFGGLLGVPLSYLMVVASGAIVALVAMRHGTSAATKTAVYGVSLLLVVAIASGTGIGGILTMAIFWLLVGLSGWVLRTTVRLELALLAPLAVLAIGVVGVYLFIGDPAQSWAALLNEILSSVAEIAPAGSADMAVEGLSDQQRQVAEAMSRLMTGGSAATAYGLTVASLLLGRYWQAALYNPGGFQPEFHSLSFGRNVTLAAAGLMALAYLLKWPVLTGLSILAIAVFVIQGLAVAHALVKRFAMSRGWLILVYVLLVQMLLLLAALGMLDNWLNLRRQKTNEGN